jgi:RNA polymerase sigma-70 factor, ECF subfamily
MNPSVAIMPPDLSASHAGDAGDDTALLTVRLARGDEAAWRDFHARYFDRLHRYLLTVAHGHEDAAADALQATFSKAVRHVHRLEEEPQLWRWLALIARGALIDLARKNSRYHAVLARFSEERSAESVADDEWKELLPESLAKLPPEDRALLAARYEAGTSLGELAAAQGTTPKAVESRLARIRARLKTWLTRARSENTRDEN